MLSLTVNQCPFRRSRSWWRGTLWATVATRRRCPKRCTASRRRRRSDGRDVPRPRPTATSSTHGPVGRALTQSCRRLASAHYVPSAGAGRREPARNRVSSTDGVGHVTGVCHVTCTTAARWRSNDGLQFV